MIQRGWDTLFFKLLYIQLLLHYVENAQETKYKLAYNRQS